MALELTQMGVGSGSVLRQRAGRAASADLECRSIHLDIFARISPATP